MYINIGEFNNALPVKLKVSRNIMPQAHTTDNIIKEDILHSKAFKKYSRNILHSDRTKLIKTSKIEKLNERFGTLINDQSMKYIEQEPKYQSSMNHYISTTAETEQIQSAKSRNKSLSKLNPIALQRLINFQNKNNYSSLTGRYSNLSKNLNENLVFSRFELTNHQQALQTLESRHKSLSPINHVKAKSVLKQIPSIQLINQDVSLRTLNEDSISQTTRNKQQVKSESRIQKKVNKKNPFITESEYYHNLEDKNKIVKEDPWKSERKQIFPIQKFEKRNPIEILNYDELREKINIVIQNKPIKKYSAKESTFNLIENTFNFDQKLCQIDEIMKEHAFKGTDDQIKPLIVYKQDEILTNKAKKQLQIIKGESKIRLSFRGGIRDHTGIVITESGSRLEGISNILVRKEGIEEVERKRKNSLQKKMTIRILQPNYAEEDILEGDSIGQMQRQKFKSFKSIRSKKSNLFSQNSLTKQKNHRNSFALQPKSRNKLVQILETLHKQKQQSPNLDLTPLTFKTISSSSQGVVEEVKEWSEEQIGQKINNIEFYEVFEKFKQSLLQEFELESQLSKNQQKQEEESEEEEHRIIKQLYSSFYNDTIQYKHYKQDKSNFQSEIVKEFLQKDDPDDEEQLEFSKQKLNKILKKHKGLDIQIDQIMNKKDFMDTVKTVHERINKLSIKKKKVKALYTNPKLDIIAQKMLDEIELKQYKYQNQFQIVMAQFIMDCERENVNPIKLFTHIQESGLNLSNISLKRGLARALAQTLKKMIPDIITNLVFNNNGFDDESFSYILDSLKSIIGLKSLHISYNNIEEQSIKSLVQYLSQPRHNGLKELLLNESKIFSHHLSQVLHQLNVSCSLESLGLSRQKFDSYGVQCLIDIVKKSQALKHLDLSYCQFIQPRSLIKILKEIHKNHKLENLNLSFNSVTTSQQGDYTKYLTSLIINSKTLIHLNLSAIGLNGTYALQIARSLRKSKTLQSLHYSGNNLDDQTLIEFRRILNSGFEIKREQHYENIQGRDINELHQFLQHDTPSSQNTFGTQLFPKIQSKLTEKFGIKKQENRGQVNNGVNTAEMAVTSNDTLVFSRYLGHLEIINGHRWIERKECFICSKWIYTLILWNSSMINNFYKLTKQSTLKYYEVENSKYRKDESNSLQIRTLPLMRSNVIQFSQVRMLEIEEFNKRIQLNMQPSLRIIENDQKDNDNFFKIKRSNNQGSASFKSNLTDSSSISNINAQIQQSWPALLKQYYRNLEMFQLITLDQVMFNKLYQEEQFYAYANYHPPQQNCSVTIQSQEYLKKLFYKEYNIEPRQSMIPLSYKRVKKYRKSRKFDLKKSVFSYWAKDLEEEYKKCFNADMKYSKIPKFVKDPDHLKEVSKILLSNYGPILELYLYSNGMSNYPNIQWIEFTDFCNDWKLIDQNLTLATVDRLFIAVNFEGVPGGLEDNPDKELCRYEFYEILVRMAQAKYPQNTIPEALCKELINNGLEKMLNETLFMNADPLKWHQFRVEEIFTLEIDDLLKANSELMKKLYKHYFVGLKKTFTLQDAIQMIQSTSLQINVREIQTAFAYSKYLIIDEMVNNENMVLLKFGEFQEIVCRIAQIHYPDPNTSLYDKVLEVLKELFTIIGAQPIIPISDDLGDSESDYDDLF